MPKLSELLAQKAALDKKIADAQRAERGDAIAQVKALMSQYGLTLADLERGGLAAAGRKGTASKAGPGPDGAASTAGSRRGRKLGKVAPKYRDDATGNTWSGRGLKPKWLASLLAAGRSIDEFRI